MTHFKTGAGYRGKIGNIEAVLVPSMQPGHHWVKLVTEAGEAARVKEVLHLVFSDYVPALLRQKGFDVDLAQWCEYDKAISSGCVDNPNWN
jgi:hypothetical protein